MELFLFIFITPGGGENNTSTVVLVSRERRQEGTLREVEARGLVLSISLFHRLPYGAGR